MIAIFALYIIYLAVSNFLAYTYYRSEKPLDNLILAVAIFVCLMFWLISWLFVQSPLGIFANLVGIFAVAISAGFTGEYLAKRLSSKSR